MVKDLKKLEKQLKQLKSKKSKESSDKIGKILNQKVTYKSSKQKQVTVTIPEYKAESPWEEDNRFFKGNFEKEKRSMFLS